MNFTNTIIGVFVTVFALGAASVALALAPPASSDKVTVEKVSFKNRVMIDVVGNLYMPKNIDQPRIYAAIVVGHPFGGVKEQTAGLHAQKLAELGYIALAFDASFQGESGGQPRQIEVPEIRVEDFSAAVDFLSNHPLVDKNRIGVLGICGGGGYSISATAIDHRIKAVATISMYDMGRARRQGLGDAISYEQRMQTLDQIGVQRTLEFDGGERSNIAAIPTELSVNDTENTKEFFDYYRTPRGQHPNSTTSYSFTSLAPMMNYFPFVQIETISPRPILMIVGERAISAYFSEDAYNKAVEAEITKNGKRLTKRFNTKREALAWEADVKSGKLEQKINTVCLAEWATAYLDFAKTKFCFKTYEEKASVFRRFFNFIKPELLTDDLTRRLMLDYIVKQKEQRSGYAANKDRKNLLAAWNWGIKYLGLPEKNPCMVDKMAETRQPRYVPPEADFWAVYNVCDEINKSLLLAFLYTAARRGELEKLLWSDIDFNNGTIHPTQR